MNTDSRGLQHEIYIMKHFCGGQATAVQINSLNQHLPQALFGFTSSVYQVTFEARAQRDLFGFGVKMKNVSLYAGLFGKHVPRALKGSSAT